METTEAKFSALASQTRLEILKALREKRLECTDPESCDLSERCCNVNELAEKLGLSQPTVSHHLKELRRAELIESEKSGRTLYCTINHETINQLSEFLQTFGNGNGDAS